ncbi:MULTISPECIES: hypothetical protein [unclassified Rhodococcus (in: high G+C Gram-positive bacteria)]
MHIFIELDVDSRSLAVHLAQETTVSWTPHGATWNTLEKRKAPL